MLAALLLGLQGPAAISRDAFGVPSIAAPDAVMAYRLAGLATADDRIQQMHVSRMVASGRAAELFGQGALNGDLDTVRMGYSRKEIEGFVARLPREVRAQWQAYADGINDHIKRQKLDLEPWSTTDSGAIAIMIARRFGSGGAGELRNFGLTCYLRGQKAAPRALDVIDDFAWSNDPKAPTTVSASDDPLAKNPPRFPVASRAQTIAQLATLPELSLGEILPAVRLAEATDQRLVAQRAGVPHKMGSYAIVMDGKRSATGKPLLLGAPQMGHATPSVVHEIAMEYGRTRIAGMGVPGIPGVLIGRTPAYAWTLTSGVGDVADIFAVKRVDADHYEIDGQKKRFEVSQETLKVRGGQDAVAKRVRTDWGPVLLESRDGKWVFVQRSTLWNREIENFGFLDTVHRARDARGLLRGLQPLSLSFNFFFAFANGDIGWRYCGAIPQRAEGIDDRFPSVASKQTNWRGLIPANQMPWVLNPRTGLITNWNNKPVAWWPNGDTPIWGDSFRVDALNAAMKSVPGTPEGLLDAARRISRSDEWSSLRFLTALNQVAQSPLLAGLETVRKDNDLGALVYDESIGVLREKLFVPHVGNFFGQLPVVGQAPLVAAALEGRTKFDYLAGREATVLLRESYDEALVRIRRRQGEDESKWVWTPPRILYANQPPIPFSARGTFIQVVDVSRGMESSTIAGPGQSETGRHSTDQVDLVRNFRLKPSARF